MYKYLTLFILLINISILSANQDLQTVSHNGFFIENKGQWDPSVRYLIKTQNGNVWITNNGVTYDYFNIKLNNNLLSKFEQTTNDDSIQEFENIKGNVISMNYVSANKLNESNFEGNYKRNGYYNYFLGNDPSKWASKVPLFQEVLVKNVYKGIDIRYYIDEQVNSNTTGSSNLRYDFIVHPNADLSNIAIKFDGQENLIIDNNGEIVLGTSLGDVKHEKLFAYQDIILKNNSNKDIKNGLPVRFFKNHDGTIGISVDNYDKNKDLIIDPLVFSTFIGGNNSDRSFAIALDATANIYITGTTQSSNYPTITGSYDVTFNSGGTMPIDGIVTKLNAAGSELIYSTFIGGSGQEEFYSIATDGTGNAYVTGYSGSTDYPVTTGVISQTNSGGSDVIVTKLNSDGTNLAYSTYIGGSLQDCANSIAVDGSGYAYITGFTASGNFPTKTGSYNTTLNGNQDAFVCKIYADGSNMYYSTFIGGSTNDCAYAIAIDATGNSYITGRTASTNYPTTTGAYDVSFNNGTSDAFITKLNPAGSALVYSTFIGGTYQEEGHAIATDNSGNAYITGFTTSSSTYPVTPGAYSTIFNGNTDAFITKLSSDGASLVYSTFLGGVNPEHGNGIVLDQTNNAYVTGYTSSNNFPTTPDAYKTTYNGGVDDVFLSRISETGSTLVYSTFIGGNSDDQGNSIAIDASGNLYLSGETSSLNYPTTGGTYDQTFNGGTYDVFVSKITFSTLAPVIESPTLFQLPSVICSSISVDSFYVKNIGNTDLSITLITKTGTNASEFTLIQPIAPVTVVANDSVKFKVQFSPLVVGNRTAALNLINNSFVSPYTINLTGTKDSIGINIVGLTPGDTLNFGTVCPDNQKDVVVPIKNTSNVSTRFLNSAVLLPYHIQNPEAFNTPFNPNEIRNINIRFQAVPDTGLYVESFTLTDTCGKVRTINLKAEVRRPFLDLTRDESTCGGLSVRIGELATGGKPPYVYSWSPISGLDNPNIAQPNASPTATTKYYITVTDNNGCSLRDSVTVNIGSGMIVNTGLNGDTTVCHNSAIQFNSSVTGGSLPYTYSWTPANLFDNPAAAKPTIVIQQNTQIILTVTDNRGCSTSDTVNIKMFPRMTVDAGGDLNVCLDSVPQFQGSVSGGTIPYSSIHWVPSTGLSNANVLNPFVALTTPGFYLYTLFVTDDKGCTESDTVKLNLYPKLKANAGGTVSSCLGTPTNLNGSATGGMTPYNITSWDPPFGLDNPNILNPLITINSPGTYQYVLTVIDANKCIATDTVVVTIFPKANVVAGNDTVICKGTNVQLQGSVSGDTGPYTNVYWEPSIYLNNSNILNPTANISSPGIYKYYLNVIDINNCLSLDSVTITVKDVPNLTFNTQMLDFGVLESCSNSKTDSIVITNSGTDNIVVDSIHFDSGFGKFSPALPISLSPGEYATVLIVFTPTSTGLAQGTLQFITKSCETIFSIQAKGTQNELLIKQDIAGMDFGQSLSCESIDKTDTLTLSNTGTANILLDFTQTGIIAPYTLVEPSGTATLSPSTDIKVVVRYKPTTAGNFNQVARIPYTAGACLDTINFSLTANNIEVNTTASYQNVDFPPLTECQTTKDTVISIQNTGNVLLQVIAVEQAPVFITTDSLPISIQPGETKQLNLTFSPTAQGNFNGRVVLQYSLCANTDTIALSGIKQGVVFVTTDTLNLGELVICRDSAISVTDSIVNATNVGTGGTITSVSIDPHFETTLKRGTLLPPGISTKFDVSYELDASAPLGPVLGKMTIIISPCNIEKTIYLKAVKGDVKFEKVADLDFGKRETGSDSVATISFINNGTATSLINSINGVFPPFSISSIVPAVPDSLAPGDSIVIFVKYSPINIKKDTATITIGCNEPCVYHADAMITGEGIKPVEILPVELTVSIPNIKDSINRDISIPIIITSKDQLLKSKAKSFYAEISFNKTILLPFDSTDLGTINGGLRKLTLVGGISDTLYVMNFKTALGDAESTVISIDSIAFPGVKTIITKQNGTFSLMDICREGGSRLVNTDNILKLFDATPNPAGDRITFEFELIEEAPARLLISNIIGEQVVTVFETSKPGQYKIDYSTSLLDNGIYYYVLQTPSGRIGKLMGVVK